MIKREIKYFPTENIDYSKHAKQQSSIKDSSNLKIFGIIHWLHDLDHYEYYYIIILSALTGYNWMRKKGQQMISTGAMGVC